MKVRRDNHIFEIKQSSAGLGVFTKETIKKGDIVFSFSGTSYSDPTQTSIQLGDNEHIEDPLGAFINHNCSPSVVVDRQQRAFIALHDMQKGEEVTFDYNANEDNLANGFVCHCCRSRIEGKKRVKTLIYQ